MTATSRRHAVLHPIPGRPRASDSSRPSSYIPQSAPSARRDVPDDERPYGADDRGEDAREQRKRRLAAEARERQLRHEDGPDRAVLE
ncbi:hypothetical protein L1887_48195 [Cichorium endivia]|nr:hypothetical protein L1887_48195 [Cichorium endivia]